MSSKYLLQVLREEDLDKVAAAGRSKVNVAILNKSSGWTVEQDGNDIDVIVLDDQKVHRGDGQVTRSTT